jgi:hypothetical protein
MSTAIVPEICPPPEWNLTAKDIHQMVDALGETYQNYRPAFERSDQAAHGRVYLKGLLSDIPRKVIERIALRSALSAAVPDRPSSFTQLPASRLLCIS